MFGFYLFFVWFLFVENENEKCYKIKIESNIKSNLYRRKGDSTMAFTRKFLSALGIEADKVEEIITAHTEVTDALKEERDKYKAEADKASGIQKENEDLKAKMSGDDPYQKKYEELQKEFETFKNEIEAEKTSAKKEAAFRKALRDIGIPEKRVDSVVRVSDIASLELDQDGNIKDGEAYKEKLKTEWSDFIPTTRTEGANVATPPANNGKTTMTRAEIRAIADPVARQKAMMENPSAVGLPDYKS